VVARSDLPRCVADAGDRTLRACWAVHCRPDPGLTEEDDGAPHASTVLGSARPGGCPIEAVRGDRFRCPSFRVLASLVQVHAWDEEETVKKIASDLLVERLIDWGVDTIFGRRRSRRLALAADNPPRGVTSAIHDA
jgi:hypothetical protein